MSPIPEERVQKVCKPGQKTATCAFLTMGPGGMLCAKAMPSVRLVVETRVANDTMGAKGDNCPGWYA